VTAAAPGAETRYPLAVEIAAAATVLAYGYIIVRVVPAAVYVPVNLAAAGLAVALVHARDAGWDDLGLAREKLGRGLRLGLLTVLPIAAVVATGVALTVSRKFFVEARFTDLDTARKLYELLVRIPLGTALSEELIFRGALLGLYLRRHTFLRAALLSSLVFGLWHVVGALAAVQSNAAGEVLASPAARVGGVLATVVATGAAGMVFCWLRRRSGSVVTPAITHAALNGLSVVGGLVAARWLGG
jgi:membrane protease YdiL (CAAX protease family)